MHSKGPGFGPDRSLIIQKNVSIKITNHLKTGVQPTPETSCISNTPQTMENVQHSVTITNVTALQAILCFEMSMPKVACYVDKKKKKHFVQPIRR
jgi:hypothetical protein